MRGRPTKFRKDLIKDAEVHAALGFTEKDLAAYWGVSKRTFEYWKKRNNGELLHALLKGKLSANISITKQLFNQAITGNIKAIIFWLTNRCPEYWKHSRALIYQAIRGQGDINVTTNTRHSEIRQMVSSWTPEQKRRYVEVARALDKEFKTGRIGQYIEIKGIDNDRA